VVTQLGYQGGAWISVKPKMFSSRTVTNTFCVDLCKCGTFSEGSGFSEKKGDYFSCLPTSIFYRCDTKKHTSVFLEKRSVI
jgi:hypothetical protein